MILTTASALLLLSATPLDPAVVPQKSPATAKANARADAKAKGSDKKTAKSSHTRRVVVVNGKTIVDEETRDGRVVGGAGKKRGKGLPIAAPPALPDLDKMMREMQEDMLKDLPPDARAALRKAMKEGKGVSHSSSSSKDSASSRSSSKDGASAGKLPVGRTPAKGGGVRPRSTPEVFRPVKRPSKKGGVPSARPTKKTPPKKAPAVRTPRGQRLRPVTPGKLPPRRG